MSVQLRVRFSGRNIDLDMKAWETIKDVRKNVVRILVLNKYKIKLKTRLLGNDVLGNQLSLASLRSVNDIEYSHDNDRRTVLYCELVKKEKKNNCTVM